MTSCFKSAAFGLNILAISCLIFTNEMSNERGKSNKKSVDVLCAQRLFSTTK